MPYIVLLNPLAQYRVNFELVSSSFVLEKYESSHAGEADPPTDHHTSIIIVTTAVTNTCKKSIPTLYFPSDPKIADVVLVNV